ncbi:MAG: hypothetical protein MUE82_10605 [Chloroflexi bacterium]|jgi:hypothetical protein|nr:hypothetical protein [Chloroflexota bacterium]
MPITRVRAARRPGAVARALAAVIVVSALASAVAACGSGPSPSGAPTAAPTSTAAPSAAETPATTAPPASPSPDASPEDPVGVLKAIADDVAALRGLAWKTPVDPRIIDEPELRRLLEQDFEASGTSVDLADIETLYRGLGAMSGDRTLEDLYLDALGSQVLGFYRDDDRTLYIVRRSGGLGGVEKYTAAHELTHALQDQHFGIATLGLETPGQSDRALGALSLVEGDASLAGVYWSQGHLSLADLGEIIRAASEPAAQGALDALPPLARESLTFPYLQGLEFVMRLQAAGGWDAVDAAYAKPPASSEQVLHPEKYAAGEEPVAVELPADLATRLGAGWDLAYEDTLGELGLRTWLAQGNAADAANAAAAGWGGDRVGLYRGPEGAWAIVLRTAWDDAAGAGRFTEAARRVVETLPHATIATGAEGPMILAGSDASGLAKLKRAAGE